MAPNETEYEGHHLLLVAAADQGKSTALKRLQ
jgi:hypothetical protein